MIEWVERMMKGTRGQFIAIAEVFQDGRPVYRNGPRNKVGSYLICAHGWTEKDALAKRERDKPLILAELEQYGHA